MEVTVGTAELRTVWEDDYFSIGLDEADSVLFYKIHGYPKCSEQIRHGHDELFKICMEMQRRSSLRYMVADLTDAKILLMPDIRFIGTVSYPRLAKTGILKLAILLGDDFHVRMNVQKTIGCMKPKVFQQIKLFPFLEPALDWFRMLP